jgi:flagellar biogenesis protein FliO
MSIIIALILLICTGGVVASDAEQGEKPGLGLKGFDIQKADGQTDAASLVYRMFLSLVIVAVLGAGIIFLSKKVFPKYTTGKGKYISIIETVNIGSNNKIHLIEVQGRRILIGSSNGAVSKLSEPEKNSEYKKISEQINREHS